MIIFNDAIIREDQCLQIYKILGIHHLNDCLQLYFLKLFSSINYLLIITLINWWLIILLLYWMIRAFSVIMILLIMLVIKRS